ncbi:MAG TPA: MFS transporter [Streptosporangiaceae bacterium]
MRGRTAGFWLLAAVLGLLLAAASAPSPLYAIYAERWGFSSTTLTAIFAVYALALLAALLTTGRLSDRLGRRPVLAAGLAVMAAAMAAFVLAHGVTALYVARILQGVGTGIATGAISAWLLDLEPPTRPGLGSVAGAIAPMVGLAAGAVGSAVLVQYGPDPLRLVYWVLTAAFVAALVALPLVADDVRRTRGWLAGLRPRVGVPPEARALFAASAPSLIATWALGALYLSLGPSLAVNLLADDSRLAGGLVIAALAGAGAIASVAARSRPPRAIVVGGSLVLIVGVGMTLLAVATDIPALLYAGSVVAGVGFGPAFSGVFRSLAPLAEPQERSGLLAAIYVVSYLAFSLPAVAAGVAVTRWGLHPTTYAYGAAVMTLALATTVAVSGRRA